MSDSMEQERRSSSSSQHSSTPTLLSADYAGLPAIHEAGSSRRLSATSSTSSQSRPPLPAIDYTVEEEQKMVGIGLRKVLLGVVLLVLLFVLLLISFSLAPSDDPFRLTVTDPSSEPKPPSNIDVPVKVIARFWSVNSKVIMAVTLLLSFIILTTAVVLVYYYTQIKDVLPVTDDPEPVTDRDPEPAPPVSKPEPIVIVQGPKYSSWYTFGALHLFTFLVLSLQIILSQTPIGEKIILILYYAATGLIMLILQLVAAVCMAVKDFVGMLITSSARVRRSRRLFYGLKILYAVLLVPTVVSMALLTVRDLVVWVLKWPFSRAKAKDEEAGGEASTADGVKPWNEFFSIFSNAKQVLVPKREQVPVVSAAASKLLPASITKDAAGSDDDDDDGPDDSSGSSDTPEDSSGSSDTPE